MFLNIFTNLYEVIICMFFNALKSNLTDIFMYLASKIQSTNKFKKIISWFLFKIGTVYTKENNIYLNFSGELEFKIEF